MKGEKSEIKRKNREKELKERKKLSHLNSETRVSEKPFNTRRAITWKKKRVEKKEEKKDRKEKNEDRKRARNEL